MRKRSLAALVLVVCACGRGDRADAPPVSGALPSSGPDPIVVRLPREGGVVRAFRYPALDSSIWRSAQPAPPLDRVLAFDGENGAIAYLTGEGLPGWLDLRLGTVRSGGKARLASLASSDGWAIFGISDKQEIVRLTPSGDWKLPAGRAARRLFPLADGTLLVLADEGTESVVLRLRPPDDVIGDSTTIPRPSRAVGTAVGDRVYFAVDRELLSVDPQALSETKSVTATDEILSLAPTPSGDRVFLANKGGSQLDVLDRYSDDLETSALLPGLVTELRMDPMGRFLLARPVAGDSAWIVSISTGALVGTVRSAWRSDLPAVAPDGAIAVVAGPDVAFVDASTGKTARRVAGGAGDVWFFTLWNGFRPRARNIDAPVSFSLGESERPAARDSARAIAADTAAPTDSVAAATPRPVETVPPPPPPPRDRWTVSFAAVLTEARAREIAATITVDGQQPRVLAGQTGGTTIYRVVFGPFGSKAEADRIGRASMHNYWVYEGVP